MEEQKSKSWFRRNWLWFVPSMGCLTLIILAISGIIGAFAFLTNPDTTRYGIQLASKNEKIVELLGKPIEDYGVPQGNMTYSSSDGKKVDMTVPIRGPKGEGTLTIKGSQQDGIWIFESLYVKINGSEDTFNLLGIPLE